MKTILTITFTLLIILSGCNPAQQTMEEPEMTETGAIEMFSYKPVDGAALEDVMAMDARVKKEYVELQPGYISRYTTTSADGTVSVFVHWESMANIEASQAKAMKDPLMGEYMGMMNQETLVFSNLTVRQ